MVYKLVYTNRAVKDIAKLDIVAKRRLKVSLEKLASSPLKHSKKLIDSRIGEYRYRIGDYRVIFDLTEEKEIVILRIGHRKEIYR